MSPAALFAAEAARDALDRYYTPDVVADAFVRWLQVPAGLTVIEPSVGGGAWARAIRRHAPACHLTGVDLDPGARGLALCDEAIVGDWTTADVPQVGLVVGNPPYGEDAAEHVRRALTVAPVVALLLRETFTQPASYAHLRDPVRRARLERRSLILDAGLALQWTWPERIAFGGGSGADSVLHSLLIWRRGHRGPWLREMMRPDVDGWRPWRTPWEAP